MIRRPPRSPLFPYTTLSRSERRAEALDREVRGDFAVQVPAEAVGHGHQQRARRLPVADAILIDAPHAAPAVLQDRKSTRLNCSHSQISYAVFCLKKKKK